MSAVAIEIMGERKKRRKPPPAQRPVDPPKKMIASFRGSPEFERWFRSLVAYVRLPMASVIEHALIDFAEKHGFKDEPPPRV